MLRALTMLLGSSLLSGCLLLYSVVEGDDGTAVGGGGEQTGGAGGSGGGGGEVGVLPSYPLGAPGSLIAWSDGRGGALSGPRNAASLWHLTEAAAPERIAEELPAATGLAVSSSGDLLLAKSDVAAPDAAVFRCDAGGCSDWATSSPPVAFAGLASFGENIAALRRDDGLVEVFSNDGESLAVVGDPADEGLVVAARGCGDGDTITWATAEAGATQLHRARRPSQQAAFDEPEVIDVDAEIVSVAIAEDCAVFYLLASDGGSTLQLWSEGAPAGLDLGIASTSDGRLAAGTQRMFVTLPAEGALTTVGVCELPDPGSTGCLPAPIECGAVGGIAADASSDTAYFTCDDAIVVWSR